MLSSVKTEMGEVQPTSWYWPQIPVPGKHTDSDWLDFLSGGLMSSSIIRCSDFWPFMVKCGRVEGRTWGRSMCTLFQVDSGAGVCVRTISKIWLHFLRGSDPQLEKRYDRYVMFFVHVIVKDTWFLLLQFRDWGGAVSNGPRWHRRVRGEQVQLTALFNSLKHLGNWLLLLYWFHWFYWQVGSNTLSSELFCLMSVLSSKDRHQV